jgi:hypothetical protein
LCSTHPYQDLTGAQLKVSHDELSVKWLLAGSPPSKQRRSLQLQLEIVLSRSRGYLVTASMDGHGWSAGSQAVGGAGRTGLYRASQPSVGLPPPTQSGDTVVASIPLSLLPGFKGPFGWIAYAAIPGKSVDELIGSRTFIQ